MRSIVFCSWDFWHCCLPLKLVMPRRIMNLFQFGTVEAKTCQETGVPVKNPNLAESSQKKAISWHCSTRGWPWEQVHFLLIANQQVLWSESDRVLWYFFFFGWMTSFAYVIFTKKSSTNTTVISEKPCHWNDLNN